MRLEARSSVLLIFKTANSDRQLQGKPESQQAPRRASSKRWSMDLKSKDANRRVGHLQRRTPMVRGQGRSADMTGARGTNIVWRCPLGTGS